MTVNQKAKSFRESLGLSIDDFCPLVGFSKTYVSMLENGEREFSSNAIKAYLKAGAGYFQASDFFTEGAC